MGLREDLARRIEKKRAEIVELQIQVRLAEQYLQAMEDMLRLVPRDQSGSGGGVSPSPKLRPGSSLAKARDAILKAGRPLYVTELLGAIGKGTTRNDRAGLSGTLAAYVRRGEIFTRPAPNTFGLVEMPADERGTNADGPPPGFGRTVSLLPSDFVNDDEEGNDQESF